MSRSTNIFVGLFGAFAVSIYAMVLVPQRQLGKLEPVFTEEEGRFSDVYPVSNAATDQGRDIYVDLGCISCHSQQVRDPHMGTDIDRGWGPRRTVARDYLYDEPALLGNTRLGPDLTNVGNKDWRNEPKGDLQRPKVRDAAWHYLHLYAPRVLVKESNHPPYKFLFQEIPLVGERSSDALALPGDIAPVPGKQIVPTNEAKSLVAYLLGLDRTHAVPEAAAVPGAGDNTPQGNSAATGAPPPAGTPAAPAAPAGAAPAGAAPAAPAAAK